MKRYLALITVCVFLFSCAACAEGKLVAKDKTLILYDGDDTGFFYARVENVGDEAVATGSGDLVIFDEDDEILASESYVTSLPTYISVEPGDYVYVKEFLWDSALENATVSDFKFSMPEYSSEGNHYTQLDCTARYDITDSNGYNNYVYVSFTNTTSTAQFDTGVTAALYDEQDQLMFVDYVSMGSVAVEPGSSVTVRMYVDQDHMKYYEKHGIKPARIDAKVYTEKE